MLQPVIACILMKLFKYSFEGHSCSYDDDVDNNDNVFAQAKNAQFL